MPVTLDDRTERLAYWPIPLVRALPTAILALVITFSADHSARFGLVAFGVFALVSGALLAVLSWVRLRESGVRGYLVAQGVLGVGVGALALSLTPGGVASLFLVLTAWAVLTGALEAYSGVRTRKRHVASADWLTAGVITLVAAVAFVLIPPEFRQEFTGPDGVPRVLDAAVIAVGMLGAYAAVIAVYLVIAGVSAKSGTSPESAPVEAEPRRHVTKGETP